jgi:FkbM family methyltransferase
MVFPSMLSYAQNHEDVFLRRRLFPDQKEGFYIDVGANDPVSLSVTKHFYDSGWCGLNIEPQREVFTRLVRDRPRDINLNVALSDRPGNSTLYEAIGANGGLSTLSCAQAEAHRARGVRFAEYSVPITTLSAVAEHYVRRPIDFMSIDVEGHEQEVLKGGDWKRWRPRVLVIESITPLCGQSAYLAWEDLLLAEDYIYAHFDGVNRFYVRCEDRHLIEALGKPVNATDDYVPFEYHRQILELREALACGSEPRQDDVAHFARKIRAMKTRFPHAYALLRRAYRMTTTLRSLNASIGSYRPRAAHSRHD